MSGKPGGWVALGLVGLLALLPSCAPRTLETRWQPVEALVPGERSKHPDAAAVVLQRRLHYRVYKGLKTDITEKRIHEVTAIQSEAGLDHADVRITLPPKSRLLELRARARLPDGTIAEVDSSQMLEQDATDTRDEAQSQRIFRFPDVRVGSVLEYVATIQYPWRMTSLSSQVSDTLPVERFEVTVDCQPHLVCGMTLYGSDDVQPTLNQLPEGLWRLQWSGKDFEALKSEPMAPDWHFDHVWWAVRIRPQWGADNFLPSDFEGELEWGRAIGGHARYYLNGSWSEGFVPPVPAIDADCARVDQDCRLERAVAWVRKALRQDGLADGLGARSLKEILQREQGTSTERTLILNHVLRKLGFETWLAATGRDFLDRDYPAVDQLNQLLVFLPGVGGPKGTFIDLSCEACLPGELPPWSRDADVLLMRTRGDGDFPRVEAKWGKSHGGPYGHEDTAHSTLRARIGGQGELEADLTLVWGGRHYDALLRFGGRAKGHAHRDRGRELVQTVRRTAQQKEYKQAQCDPATRLCTESLKLRLPEHVREAGDLRLITLPSFPTSFDHQLEPGPRQRGLRRKELAVRTSELVFELPEGWDVAALPESGEAHLPYADVKVVAVQEGRTVRVERSVRLHAAQGGPEDWPKLRTALARYHDAGHAVLILRRSTVPAAPLGQAVGKTQ